jgi:hypothetical protein
MNWQHYACWVCLTLAAIVVAWPLQAAAPSAPTPLAVTLGGIIHADSDDTLTFTPDGATVLFDRSSGTHKTILLSHRRQGQWSEPVVASFSGRWFDQNPLVAPDGSYVLFNSDRPVHPGDPPLVQEYFGRKAPGSNIWKVMREGDGFGAPVWLGALINSDTFVDFPSVAGDGSIYFMLLDHDTRVMHTWRAQFRAGRYLTPQRVELGDPAVPTHDPAVARDESFIVFDYGRTKGGLGRLCIAFRDGGHWSAPVDLGDRVNADLPWGARLAPDGRTLFFTGQSGVWRLPLSPWLKSARSASN